MKKCTLNQNDNPLNLPENVLSKLEISYLGLIKIEGPDTEKFLQGQLTCDVTQIDETHSRLGTHCDPKGRILSFFRLFKLGNCYFMLMPKAGIPQALEALNKYSVFFKATVSDVTNEYAYAGLIGNPATYFEKLPTDVIQQNGLTLLHGTGTAPRYLLLAPANTSMSFLENIEKTFPANVWHILDMLAGIPNIYPETYAKFLPHRLNFHEIGAISFDKGCYTGQEIIARMHYLGKLKHHMTLLTVPTKETILPGDPVFNDKDKQIGTVVDVDYHQNICYLLAVLLKDAIVDQVYVKTQGEETHAQ